jgi:hypothetical protein
MGFLKGFQVVAETYTEALALVCEDDRLVDVEVVDWDLVEPDVTQPAGRLPGRQGYSVIRERDVE